MYANRWCLHPDRRDALLVTPPNGSGERQAVHLPPELHVETAAIAVDDNGFVWACSPGSQHLFRLNPRGPGYNAGATGPTVFLAQQRYSPDVSAHTYWQRFEASALPASVVGITSSLQGLCAIVSLSDGADYEVCMNADGVSSAKPTSVATPAVSGAGRRPWWRALPARLPCGNHDITAAEIGGRVYISGGAMHYRGLF